MMNKAVRVTKAHGAVVEVQSKPFSASDVGADEVLIKNVAVASNPKDWKLAPYGVFEGIEGSDVAGYIEAVGHSVTEFSKGDRVIAFTRVAAADKYGAYQSYTVAPAWTTVKLADSVAFEDGATVPLAVATAFVGLFDKLGLPEPAPSGQPAADADKVHLLVWGASSSVGAYVVQLARISGFHVVAVAGAARDAVEALGVDGSKIVDYRADRATVIQNINAAAGASFTHVYDAISTGDTVGTIVELLSTTPNKGGKLTTLLPTAYDDPTQKSKLQQDKGITCDRVLAGSVHADRKQFGQKWFDVIGKWLAEGKVKPNKVQILEGGLDGVPAGLKLLQENKVSGAKLVARIADTKA